jgi:HD-like signal output (HDOD) protein
MPPSTVLTPDSQTIARDAVKGVGALATLPEVTSRIIATVENPRSSASELHKIISHDPALVTRILKLVNSAFYGLPQQINSIDRAIVLLGLNAVKNIAVAASLGQMFRGVKLCEGKTAKDLWTHCIAVAVAARELAKCLKLPLAEEAFLTGMIHDVGIMVSLQAWPEKTRSVGNGVMKNGGDYCQTEERIFGVDHQLLGKILAEQWKFPVMCQQVAAFHHKPLEATGEWVKLVKLVYVADTLCCQAGVGFNLTALSQQIDPAILSELGADTVLIQDISKKLPELVKAAGTVLG